MKKFFFIIMLVAVSMVVFGQRGANEVRWRDLQGITITGAGTTTVSGSYPAWTITGDMTPAFTNATIGSQVISQVNTNKAAFNNSLKVTDTLFVGSAQYIFQSTINKLKAEGSFAVTDTLTATRVEATNINASGTFTGVLPAYFDSTIYYGSSAGNVWLPFMVPQVGTPRYRADLQNMGHYSIQAKNGLSSTLAIQRDTTGASVKINLPIVLYSVQDCTHVGKQSVTDSLGLRLKSADGKIWKIRISPTGVISAVQSTP